MGRNPSTRVDYERLYYEEKSDNKILSNKLEELEKELNRYKHDKRANELGEMNAKYFVGEFSKEWDEL